MAFETIKSVFVVLMTGICVENIRKLIEAKRGGERFLKLSFKTGGFCLSMFSQH